MAIAALSGVQFYSHNEANKSWSALQRLSEPHYVLVEAYRECRAYQSFSQCLLHLTPYGEFYKLSPAVIVVVQTDIQAVSEQLRERRYVLGQGQF